jgi:CAAX prenyl protease-like protein
MTELDRASARRGGTGEAARTTEAEAWWTYAGPFVLFGLLTMIERYVPVRVYPLVYFVKICAVTASLVVAGRARRDITPSSQALALAILTGIAVFVAWVGLDKWVPYPHLGDRAGFNPFSEPGKPKWATWAFLLVRFYGLVLVVPVMEELMMRSFLLRYFTSQRFSELPMGTFSWSAFCIVAALSAASHPEWIAAIVASAAYAFLLRRTRSLFTAVVAHAVTNAALGIYVVTSGEWHYW